MDGAGHRLVPGSQDQRTRARRNIVRTSKARVHGRPVGDLSENSVSQPNLLSGRRVDGPARERSRREARRARPRRHRAVRPARVRQPWRTVSRPARSGAACRFAASRRLASGRKRAGAALPTSAAISRIACSTSATLPAFDLVVAMTSPPLISWLGAMFCAITGGRFLFWVMDLNPDEAARGGMASPGIVDDERTCGHVELQFASRHDRRGARPVHGASESRKRVCPEEDR